MLILQSCVNKIKDFTVYKIPKVVGNESKIMNLSGIYVSSNDNPPAYFFYDNGMVKTVGLNQFKKVNSKIYFDNYYDCKENWGHYFIEGNNITIQKFNKHNEEIFKRWIIEEKGIILNDTTIILYTRKSFWANQINSEEKMDSILLILKPVNIKPDSTQAWFLNKKRYRKNVHESRK